MRTLLYLYICNVLPMVWRVTNEPVNCRPSRDTNKHTQDRKRCSLLDDNSTATADYDSARANYTVNYIRQLHTSITKSRLRLNNLLSLN